MEFKNINQLNTIDSLYQDLLNTIKRLEKEYALNPNKQKRQELLYYLEEQMAYLSLTQKEKEQLQELSSRFDSLSVEDKRAYILKQLTKLEKVDGKKVTIKVGNTRKKIAESVKMDYLQYLSILNGLGIEETVPQNDDTRIVKNSNRLSTKIILPIACSVAAATIATTTITGLKMLKNMNIRLVCFSGQIYMLKEDLHQKGLPIIKETVEVDLPLIASAQRVCNYGVIKTPIKTYGIMTYGEAIMDLSNYPELNVMDKHVYYRLAKPYDGSQEEFELVCRIVWREAGGATLEENYIDSLCAASTILNRIYDERYVQQYSNKISNQIFAEGQFSTVAKLPKTSFDQVPEVVKRAVAACFNGLRSHEYVEFRAAECTGYGRTQVVEGGNNYFNVMQPIPEEKESQLVLLDETNQLTK